MLDALNACAAAFTRCRAGVQEEDVQITTHCVCLDQDCAAKCEQHAAHMPHCRACAEACRRGEQVCRQSLAA